MAVDEQFQKQMQAMNIRLEAEKAMREIGLALNPTSSVRKPLNDDGEPFDWISVATCRFCGSEIKREEIKRDDEDWSPFSPTRDVPCDCPENVANTEKYTNAYRIEHERISAEHKRERVRKLHEKSKTPKRWLDRTLDKFIVNQSNKKAYETAVEYAKVFDPTNGDGLLLSGSVGTGKTHLAAGIAMELMEREYQVVFGTINTLLSEIRYSFSDDRSESEAKLFERYTTCDLLVIDDLGKERVSDWTEQIVFDIINTRYENNKALIITTNLDPSEIREKYRENGEALTDRLFEMCKGIRLKGESWRRKAIG